MVHFELLDGEEDVYDPNKILANQELNETMLKFCSLLCILQDKKLSASNVFIILVENKDIRTLYKEICEIDDDRIALKLFLEYNNLLNNSKVIKKYAKSLAR